jgi:hypothetical protein
MFRPEGAAVEVNAPSSIMAAVVETPCTRPRSMNARNFSNATSSPGSILWPAKTIFVEVYM